MMESKAKVISIKASSSCTVKIKDNYYKIEYTEERAFPEGDDIDLDLEKQLLFDSCNNTVDTQIEDILQTFKK